jgi:hypothetical protein
VRRSRSRSPILANRDPFAQGEQRAGLDDPVESFIGTPYAETTAALTAIKVLVADEVLGAGSVGSWRGAGTRCQTG